VFAGRSADELSRLANELGGLEYTVADVTDPASVAKLVKKDDILVTTEGPFARWDRPALAVAVGRGARYIDSTGEPPFIREVFEVWSGPARRVRR
jgi:short subunit dehydrogenase-like uncharacterized protein